MYINWMHQFRLYLFTPLNYGEYYQKCNRQKVVTKRLRTRAEFGLMTNKLWERVEKQ